MKIIRILVLMSLFGAAIFGQESYTIAANEFRTKIAVIDTGIYIYDGIKHYLCNGQHYDFTGKGLNDTHGHGTNIAAIIVKDLNPQDFCIEVIKYTEGRGEVKEKAYLAALLQAASDPQVKYINLSSGGAGSFAPERTILLAALKAGKHVIVSAGNNSSDLMPGCMEYPACYLFMSPNFHVVGNGRNEQHRNFTSNYGFAVTNWMHANNVCAGENSKGEICFTGTSQAAALFTNKLIKQHTK